VGLVPLQEQEVTTVSALKQAIADAADIDAEDVFVKQWGVTVQVRSLTGHERSAIVTRLQEAGGASNFGMLYPELLIHSVYDPDTGALVFEDTDVDRDLILGKNASALEQVAKVALRLSGLTEEAEEEVGKRS
jgi:hypothetical protein